MSKVEKAKEQQKEQEATQNSTQGDFVGDNISKLNRPRMQLFASLCGAIVFIFKIIVFIKYIFVSEYNFKEQSMTIWEAKETFEEKGIKYKFYDCYAGNNDKEFVLFNTAVLLPQGLSMRYAIYASDKSNWHILNLENTRDEFLDLVLESQQARDEHYENECIKLHKATNQDEQCLIDSIDKNLAALLLEKQPQIKLPLEWI